MKYRVCHKTTYRYAEPASLSQNELYLLPRETGTQKVIESGLSIVPPPQYLHRRTDYFGNNVHIFMVQHPHRELAVTATSLVETTCPATPAPEQTPSWESVVQQLAAHADPATAGALSVRFCQPLDRADGWHQGLRPYLLSTRPAASGGRPGSDGAHFYRVHL